MDRARIISEIQQAAKRNGGAAVGWRRFENETGIKYHEWYGTYWARWGDAVREAGLEPARMVEAFDDDFLLQKLAELTRQLGRVPVIADLLMAGKADSEFPSGKVFRRLGFKQVRAARIIAFCSKRSEWEDVAELWKEIVVTHSAGTTDSEIDQSLAVGYVYLLKHGTRREYKIGRTRNPLRREGEVGLELPESLDPVHYIKTDDPAGVENYWHRRFAAKRKLGEWFDLSASDVRAFKRWKRIY